MGGVTPDGTYSYTIDALDCGTGVAMTNRVTASFIVDRLVPQVVPVSPVDGGNSFASSLVLAAKVVESGSGIDPTSGRITFQDLTTGTPAEPVAATYDATTGAMASIGPRALVSGRKYRATMSVTDYGGQTGVATVTFLAATATIPSTQVSVDATAGEVDASTCGAGSCLWKFSEVAVEVAPYQMSISNTLHAGFGGIAQDFSFGSAMISYELLGETVSVPLSQVTADANDLRKRTTYQQVATLRPDVGNQEIGAAGVQLLVIDPIEARLPTSATNVALSLSTTSIPPPCDFDHPCDPDPPGFPNTPNPGNYVKALCQTVSTVVACNPDIFIYFVSSPEARVILEREQWAATQTSRTMPACDEACKALVSTSFVNPAFVDTLVTEAILDPVLGQWLDWADAINVRNQNLLPTLEPTYPSPWGGTEQFDGTAGLAYPDGYPLSARFSWLYGPACEHARSCDGPHAEASWNDHQLGTGSAPAGGMSTQAGGDDDGPCAPGPDETCEEKCVNTDGTPAYKGNACKQLVKLTLGNKGGRPRSADNRRQSFYMWVVHGRGMRNAGFDSFSMGWKENAADGGWKSEDSFKDGKWRRAQQEAVADPTRGICYAQWTPETEWPYGSKSKEFSSISPSDPEPKNYGRHIWQGNEYLAQCPDAPSNIEVKRRLVAAYLRMSVKENNDHTPGETGPAQSAKAVAQFTHVYKTWDWSLKWPCPYLPGKYKLVPCPWTQQKTKSWMLGPLLGQEYFW